MTGLNLSKSCREEVIDQLVELQRRVACYARRDTPDDADEAFYAEQNARLVKNAKEYYRSMFLRELFSWNLRDRHISETLDALIEYLSRQGEAAKVVVWAHNSHLGDARATKMGEHGELNLGQLTRERHGGEVVLVGLTTHHGTVTAASDWGASAERKQVRPALPGSCEALFHDARPGRFLLAWREGDSVAASLRQRRLERAIGLIYRSETDKGHYSWARLPDQFDAVLHFDETRAVEPLEYGAESEAGEVPETFPFAV